MWNGQLDNSALYFTNQIVKFSLAPQVGFEPTTLRLTAACSAIELLRNTAWEL